MSILNGQVCFLMTRKYGWCCFVQTDILCLFIGKRRPLIFSFYWKGRINSSSSGFPILICLATILAWLIFSYSLLDTFIFLFSPKSSFQNPLFQWFNDQNSFTLLLSWKNFLSLLIMTNIFIRYSSVCWQLWPFKTEIYHSKTFGF